MKYSILQWNIWYQERAARVLEVLREVDADVLLLQEVTINGEANRGIHVGQYLAQALGYDLHYVPRQSYGVGADQSMDGSAILSRFPLLSRDSAFIRRGTGTVGDFTDENRTYAEASCLIDGRTRSFATTHLSYSHRFEMTQKKEDDLAALLRSIGSSRRSYIFAGDLNTEADSLIIRGIAKQLVHAGPPIQEKTWTTKPFDYNGFTETELHWRLDYVFHSKDLQVESSRILQVDASDHLPILTTFAA